MNELSWKDWIDLLDKVGRWAFLLGPLLVPLDRWVRKLNWDWIKKLEMFETRRVAGGLFGASVGGVFLLAQLQAGPIICCALFGGVFGARRLRVVGMVIGACVGIAFGLLCGTSDLLASPWWFAAALIPLGGLLAGAIEKRSGPH